MSRRIVTPIDPVAFNTARVAYLQQYPNPQPQPGTRAHRARRDAWLDLYAQHGGTVDQGDTFQAKAPGHLVEPCPLKNAIASVAFLSGKAEVTVDTIQRVNLPPDRAEFARQAGAHRDRLGCALRVKVTFRRKKKEDFKVALLAHNANPIYSNPEQTHATAYGRAALTQADPAHVQGAYDHYVGAVYTGQTGSDGKAVIEGVFTLPPSGCARYKLVAWDVNGNVVFSSAEIRAVRTYFYATFQAADPTNTRMPQPWFRQQIEQTYAGVGVELAHVGDHALAGVTYHDVGMKAVVGGAVNRLLASQRTAAGVRLRELAPFLVKFAFVDQAADVRRRAGLPLTIPNVNPGQVVNAGVFINDPGERLLNPHTDYRKCLWTGSGPAANEGDRPPTGHEWLHAAKLKSAAPNGPEVNLLAGDLTMISRVNEPDAKVELQFTIPHNFPANTAVDFSLDAVLVFRCVSGETLLGEYAGLMVQPSRNLFVASDNNTQLAAAIHELGHALGMVTNPALRGVGHDHWYDFQGLHCRDGVAVVAAQARDYHQPPLANTGTCVMFGQIPPGAPNLNFCPDCRDALRKLDLSGGAFS